MKPLVLGVALFLAAPAMAEAPAPPAAKPDHPAKPIVANKVVCRDQRIEGTRFLKRLCLTRAAWSDLEQRRNAAAMPPGFATAEGPEPYNPSQTGRGTPMH